MSTFEISPVQSEKSSHILPQYQYIDMAQQESNLDNFQDNDPQETESIVQHITQSIQHAIHSIPSSMSDNRRRSSLPEPAIPLKRTDGLNAFPHLKLSKVRSTPFDFSPEQDSLSHIHNCSSYCTLPHLSSKRRSSLPSNLVEKTNIYAIKEELANKRRHSHPFDNETNRERHLHRCPAHHQTVPLLDRLLRELNSAHKSLTESCSSPILAESKTFHTVDNVSNSFHGVCSTTDNEVALKETHAMISQEEPSWILLSAPSGLSIDDKFTR